MDHTQPGTPPRPKERSQHYKRMREEEENSQPTPPTDLVNDTYKEGGGSGVAPPAATAAELPVSPEPPVILISPHRPKTSDPASPSGTAPAVEPNANLPSSVQELLRHQQEAGHSSLLDSPKSKALPPPKEPEEKGTTKDNTVYKHRHEEEQEDIVISVQRRQQAYKDPNDSGNVAKANTSAAPFSFKEAMRKKSIIGNNNNSNNNHGKQTAKGDNNNNNNKAPALSNDTGSSSTYQSGEEADHKKRNVESSEKDDDDDDEEEESDSISSSTGTESGTESDEDDAKHRYPRFDDAYCRQLDSRRQSSILTPFMRIYGSEGGEKRVILYGRYEFISILGKGTYSKVVLARPVVDGGVTPRRPTNTNTNSPNKDKDNKYAEGDFLTDGPYVALKIFRNESSYRDAALEEASVLHLLSQPPRRPPADRRESDIPTKASLLDGSCLTTLSTVQNSPFKEYYSRHGRFVTFEEFIPHVQHPALVFPCMGASLYECLRRLRHTTRDEHRRRFYKDWTKRHSSSSESLVESPKMKKQRKEDFKDAEEKRVWLRGFPPYLIKSILYQLLLFLKYIHSRGVVHTDLKPENIVFESTHTVPFDIDIYSVCYTKEGGTAFPTKKGDSVERQLDELHLEHSPTQPNERQLPGRRRTLPLPPDSPLCSHHRDFRQELTLHHFPLPLTNQVKVIDLGAAELTETFHQLSPMDDPIRRTPHRISYFPIQTTHYRSPEVLLDLGWDSSADLFSVGCMIPELVTGECQFMPQDTLEHLAMMETVIGPFKSEGEYRQPLHDRYGVDVHRDVFSKNKRTYEHYFDAAKGRLKWPVSQEIMQKQEKLEKIKKQQGGGGGGTHAKGTADGKTTTTNYASSNTRGEGNTDGKQVGYGIELEPFVLTSVKDVKFVKQLKTIEEQLAHEPLLLDLTKRLLNYHPHLRPTAAEALEHPYFQHDEM